MMDEQQPPVQPPQPMPQPMLQAPYPPPSFPPYPPVYSQPLYPPIYPGFPGFPGYPPPPQIVYVQVPAHKPVPWSYLAVMLVGVLALVGFFFLPFVTVVDLSFTGVQYATTESVAKGLWFVVGAAALAIFIGGAGAANRPTRLWERLVSGGVIEVMGIAGSAALYQFYSLLASESSTAVSAASFFAAGFWLCVIANACLIIGGIIVLGGGEASHAH